MIARLARFALILVATVLIVAFCVVNRMHVPISFFPLPWPPLDLPVYGVLLIGVALGVTIGGLSLWLSLSPMRTEYRQLKRRFRLQEQEERFRREREEAEAAQRSLQRQEASGKVVPTGR
ncbi:MAG: DUF1049 domain-containing protein [Geminicoccaceae bacterium]|nr:DUF1049 domain-containing protein [Geminicoccaceae bacterium]